VSRLGSSTCMLGHIRQFMIKKSGSGKDGSGKDITPSVTYMAVLTSLLRTHDIA